MSAKSELPPKPLSERMRPKNLDELAGQEHILSPDRMLRKAIDGDNFPSFILWGPPGSGKTSLAMIIKNKTRGFFRKIAGVTSGVKDVRQIVEEARVRADRLRQKTVLFVDEIHRFNKAQQDAFLPHVESGLITLIGATTENPYFEVITPLLSRARVFKMNPLSEEQIRDILKKALIDPERGLGKYNVSLDSEGIDLLARSCGGDARIALNAMESAVLAGAGDNHHSEKIIIGTEQVMDSLQQKTSPYDRAGDNHYDIISAFIKSVRGSDPDGALYYLARMLFNGEDPKFVARRLIILASEDVGLADPFALNVANATAYAVQFVGMPEARITLASATVYLACAPKSNSAYMGIERAMKEVKNRPSTEIPVHLRNPVNRGMKALGYGEGYKYAHDYPDHFAPMEFLPEQIKESRFYYPGKLGHEKRITERLHRWWGDRFRENDQD